MPKTNRNSCSCVNGCGEMKRQDDYNFVSKIIKEKPLNIDPGSGVPVKIYFCPKCGYIEQYLGIAEGLEL